MLPANLHLGPYNVKGATSERVSACSVMGEGSAGGSRILPTWWYRKPCLAALAVLVGGISIVVHCDRQAKLVKRQANVD